MVLLQSLSSWEKARQPVTQEVLGCRFLVAEEEVIHPREEVQFRRLAGLFEKINRLFGRRHGIDGRVHEQQWTRRDL